MTELSKRQKIILAALAAGEPGAFAPVQIQKLFFLLDRNIPDELGGAQFSFTPYDYGPFDSTVYHELEHLARVGYVAISASPGAGRRKFSLTPAGAQIGARSFEHLSERARDYMARVSLWIRSLSFAELVGAIYQQYPEMKANSVFRG